MEHMKTKTIFKSLLFSLFALSFFITPFFVHAEAYKGLGDQGAAQSLVDSADAADAGTDLPTMIGAIIGVVLGVLGIILVFFLVQAGIMYMTAGGDSAKVDKAKKLITNAIVGMVIVVMAYSISTFVIGQLTTIQDGSSPSQKLDKIINEK
jgi:hypothetical protein